MNNFIVITSIFQPSEAIFEFAKRSNYKLLVVGDKKTPADWHYKNVHFISVEDQFKLNYKLPDVLPYNHYCRKMIGYLYAIQNGAECIVDTDDDNIPKADWQFPDFDGNFDCIDETGGFINVYQLYTKEKIWPRGLPLNLINKQFDLNEKLRTKECNVGIWQGLADEDPDVDAIYRLVSDTPVYFEDRPPVVLAQGTLSPFNSQNTLFKKELFPLLYLPTYVTFRFTDILRGFVAQPIMWLYNYQLGFTNATVIQRRNPHDYMKDFISEIPMYEHCETVIETVTNSISKSNNISDNLFNAYSALLKKSIVCDQELATLEAWLKDLENFTSR